MGKINVLDVNIANMIAAGEVVERPSSVVKELVENSIDANAKNITVEIKNGGMSYIRVTDDGDGIEPDDVKTAFLPHATSKIKTSDDLAKIYTLGFRGEALASIAAVARVEIYTKTKNNKLGKMLAVEGGVVTEESDAGCSDGTTIIVRNLFYNTPARMKFLKKDATEASYVSDVINKIILGNPHIAVKYICSSRQVASAGDGNLKSSIFTVYGKDYLKHLIEVNYDDDNIKVSGFIGNSSLSKKNRSYQTFFINGRNIMSKTMSAALGESYKNTVMVGQFPFAVLCISVNSAFVDVNVHPTKMEVRFSDDKKIFDAVYWACKNALGEKKHVPSLEIKRPNEIKRTDVSDKPKVTVSEINFLKDAFVKDKSEYIKSDETKKEAIYEKTYVKPEKTRPFVTKESLENKRFSTLSDNLSTLKKDDEFVKSVADVTNDNYQNDDTVQNDLQIDVKIESSNEKNDDKNGLLSDIGNTYYRVVGQVFSTYIIVEKDGEMHIIDQHAAHERLYFEEFLKDLKEGKVYSQMMLIPATIDLTPIEFDTVMQNKEFFAKLGFDIDAFGSNVIIIREVPETLIDINLKDLIGELIEIVSQTNSKTHTDTELAALHTMACKRAMKGNHTLTMAEMEALVASLSELNSINTCPHGRPIEIKMTKKELEKNFRRIV